MIIKNYKDIAITKLRKDLFSIADAGISAILPKDALRRAVVLDGEILKIGKERFNLSKYRNIYLVGSGKMAFTAANYMTKLLGNRITEGVIIDVKAGKTGCIKCHKGTHPLPSEINITATDDIISLLKKAGKNDLVISIISGGGSVLLCAPDKSGCLALQQVTKALMSGGADIKEMNTVRKHLSKIHGGGMAKFAYPAEVAGMIFSDIPFKDLSMVSSGPTYLDKTTKKDAERIAKKYDIKGLSFSETPKDDKYFKNVKNILVIDNRMALKAMANEAKVLGYKPVILSAYLKGPARTISEKLLITLKPKTVVLAGGETTVIVRKKGKGGRNLEAMLGAIGHINKNQIFASIASDGKDHIKEAAGAFADALVVKEVADKGYDSERFIDDNQSYELARKTNSIIKTGITGGNVSDLLIAMEE